jgi:hypothetical protein
VLGGELLFELIDGDLEVHGVKNKGLKPFGRERRSFRTTER